MRVFVSSTVYDLIDIRCELEALLRDMGASPVMSDEKLSDFNVDFQGSSIETCLLNVASSDYVVVVLDQRYGPRLGKHGFEDVSATHLEYRHALKHQKQILFFVRDRLEADHDVFRRNGPKAILSWIRDPNDRGLFEFLEDRKKLDLGEPNWRLLFSNSRDLKDQVRHHLAPAVTPESLLDALYRNHFPRFSILESHQSWIARDTVSVTIVLKNSGGAPAFNVTTQYGTQSPTRFGIICPGETVTVKGEGHQPEQLGLILILIFDAAYIGVKVREVINLEFRLGANGVRLTRGQQTFIRAPRPSLTIHDPT